MLYLFLNAVRRRLDDERGLALPLALGVTVIVSSLCAGIFAYATTNQGAAHRATADQRAYGLAEAGLSFAFSTLEKADDANPYTAPAANAVPSTTVTLPGGTVVYDGTLSGNTWTLTGVSTVANPSGPSGAPVVRRVSAQALVTTTTGGDLRPYDYLFIDLPSGCFTLNNTVTLEVALYVRGDLCLENNSFISSPAVHVLGNVHVNSPQASVGTSSAPIPDFSITGSCYRNGTLTACSASATSRVWASGYGTSPPVLTKPVADIPGTYLNANLGPMSNCTPGYGTGSFPGGFDNDAPLLNVSRGSIDLTPATAYDCQKWVSGQMVAQLKWVPGSNPSQTGNLTIKGIIFFDGNLTWSNLSKIQYDGRGSIYASGTLTIQNQARLCGVEACDATWVPSQDFLAFVVGSMTSAGPPAEDTGVVGNNVKFQGAIYLVNDYEQDNNTTIWGPVIARNGTITNSGLFKPLPGPMGDLPPGLPASITTVTNVQIVPGSYAG